MGVTHIIRASACREVGWKNGGGTTREIAVFPPGAGMDDFLWRLSMAKVDRVGPFSAFVGIDRILTVLKGALRLVSPDFDLRLAGRDQPFAFSSEMEVAGEPLGGPVLDLNLMVRRDRFAGRVERLVAGQSMTASGVSFIVALEDQLLDGEPMGIFDCAGFAGTLTVSARALGITIEERARA